MSCLGCTKKYGLFTKEVGCPNCGFSYCSKCLKQSCAVPKLNQEKRKVCTSCFNKLSCGSTMSQNIEPPDVFLKDSVPPSCPQSQDSIQITRPMKAEDIRIKLCLRRLESLDNPSRPPITLYQNDVRMQKLKRGLTEEADMQIAERLEKLREERRREPAPSEEDIRRRLAILKGENPDDTTENKKSNLLAPDNRSDQEKSDDLLKQIKEEQELSAGLPTSESEISARLDSLRGLGRSGDTTTLNKEKEEDASSEDESDAADKIVDRYVQEAVLGGDNSDDEIESPSEKQSVEFPWCVICNEDAVYRCPQCENDLYCSGCFKMGHKEWGMTDHKPEPFKTHV